MDGAFLLAVVGIADKARHTVQHSAEMAALAKFAVGKYVLRSTRKGRDA